MILIQYEGNICGDHTGLWVEFIERFGSYHTEYMGSHYTGIYGSYSRGICEHLSSLDVGSYNRGI